MINVPSMQMARAPEVPKSNPRYSFCELDCAAILETIPWRDDFCLQMLLWKPTSSFTCLTDPRDPTDIQRVSSVTQVNDGWHLMPERR